ncbi:MAG: AAA family ATPase [Pirellulaceae bacterium]
MRLNDIQVDGFGVWKGLTVDNLDQGMTLFYGRNEAGKTTLMQFLRTIMFGFSPDRRERYIPPLYGGLAGGQVHTITPHGNFVVQRHVDPNRVNDTIGDLVVIDDNDGSNFGKAQLNTLLSGIDESIFNNVFAIGLREIQELNTLNSTDAAEHLYKLTSGLDRVSLVDVMRNLAGRRETIWSHDPERRSQLGELQNRRRALQREIDDLLARSRRWTKVAAQTNDVSRQLEELEDQLRQLERNAKVIEVAMQVGDRWRSRLVIDEQIHALGNLPTEQEVSVKDLEKLNQKIAQQREKMAGIKKNRKAIKREADELPINRTLWSQAGRVDAMVEHLPWIEALERQAERLRGEMDSIRQTIGGESTGLGSQLNLKAHDVRDLTNRGFAALQSTAKSLSAKHEEIETATEHHSRAKHELSQYEGRMQSALVEHSDGIGDTREDASRLVNRLRRRLELEEKIEKLNASRHELERDIDDVVNEQVLPVGKLAMLGCVFILGIVFAGFGLLSLWWTGGTTGTTATEVGFLFMVLGTVFGLFSLALKHHWERVARDELEDFRHQFDLVRQQLKRAKAERDDIERHLPAGIGDWDLQLRDAEGDLARLEDLIPLESRYKTAIAHVEESERRMEKLERERDEIDRKWRDNLRLVGMPDDLPPEQLTEITRRSERLVGFHTRLEQLESEVYDRDKELSQLTKRIDSLLSEVGLEYEIETDPATRLQTLRVSLGEQRRLMGQRKELANKFRSLRNTYLKASRELDRLLGQKRRMLSQAGAENEEEFRQIAVNRKQRQKLIRERKNLSDQIAAALGDQVSEKLVGVELEDYGQHGLEKRWESLQKEIEELRQHQSNLHQQRGEFLQEVKMLGEDSRLDEARLELGAVVQEMDDLKRQWRTLAVSSQMLESIRESYEAKRQPETLLEASSFLEKLTEGHYTRIWTRLTGEELLVDNAKGETLSVEHLSRGTREAVYLGLRLALVDAYARRGAVLPLVLDDVLVNFDANRARAAAEVLRDFASGGYQVLMFTCHDHIRDLFHRLDTDVRVLPHHRDVVDSNAMPMMLAQAEIDVAPQPEVVEHVPVPALQMETHRPVYLETDEFDSELAFELSAIGEDQQREVALDERLSRYEHRANSTDAA